MWKILDSTWAFLSGEAQGRANWGQRLGLGHRFSVGPCSPVQEISGEQISNLQIPMLPPSCPTPAGPNRWGREGLLFCLAPQTF